MPSLIGNKPNQVPTNADLGTLAFQDANAVNITGGTASLTSVASPSVTNAGTLALSATGANAITASTNGVVRTTIDASGNLIQSAPATPPTLTTNGQMVFNLTSNTNLRVSVRGSDGVTRTANIILI
jgi:hypothetical protein